MQADTPQQATYIHQTPQYASYAQQEPYQTTYMPQIPILPQQHNYSVHTSQAATTSRAATQTADFSEAGESTDSNYNDERGKKRTGPRTTKLPTMKKNKPQETDNHPTQITITLTHLKLCDKQNPRAILNTNERIQHRYLSCSD
jgi:hypothetical protein